MPVFCSFFFPLGCVFRSVSKNHHLSVFENFENFILQIVFQLDKLEDKSATQNWYLYSNLGCDELTDLVFNLSINR